MTASRRYFGGLFVGSHAVAEGVVTRRQLESGLFRRVLHNVYVDPSVVIDHEVRARAAALLMPPEAAWGAHIDTETCPIAMPASPSLALTCVPEFTSGVSMIQRVLAAAGLLVGALCQAVVLPGALGGADVGTWLAWALLFGGLGAAVAVAAQGDRPSWLLAGGLGLALLDVSLVAQLAGLPGQPARPWDVPAVVALAAEALVLGAWLLATGPRVVRAVTVGGAATLVAGLLPFGAGAPAVAAPADLPPSALGAPIGHNHDHAASGAPAAPVAGDGAPLEDQLAAARAAATPYRTLADAQADGWTQADDYIAGVGAHWMKYDRIDSVFDPSQPEMLQFASNAPDAPLVGLTYYVVHRQPAGFTGDGDVWHQHENICIGADGPRFAGDGATGCKARWDWSWMLHAWVVPGWENPDGVFAAENPRV